MTPVIGIVIFLVLFAVLMVSVGLGSRFLELRGKKQMETILNPSTGQSRRGRDVHPGGSHEPRSAGRIPRTLAAAGRYSDHAAASWLAVGSQPPVGGDGGRRLLGAVLGYVLQPLGFGLASVLAFGFVLGGLPLFYVRYKRSSRLKLMEEQLPEALDFLARSMRAGHAFSISLEMIGAEMPDPMGQEFRALFAEHNLGARIETAMANFGKRVPLLDVRLFISSVALQRQTGGNLSEVLTRLAFLIRERFRLRGQVKAASAHGRLTSMVLTVLPHGHDICC